MTKLRTWVLVLAAAFVAVSNPVSCTPKCRESAAAGVCPPFSCGDILNISCPFHLQGDPTSCGTPEYKLKCEHSLAILETPSTRYWVKAIWYEAKAIQVIDANAMKGASFFFSAPSNAFCENDDYNLLRLKPFFISLINCTTLVGSTNFVEAKTCMVNASTPRSSGAAPAAATEGPHLYWGSTTDGLPQGCSVVGTWCTDYNILYSGLEEWERPHCTEVRDALLQGYNLTWSPSSSWPRSWMMLWPKLRPWSWRSFGDFRVFHECFRVSGSDNRWSNLLHCLAFLSQATLAILYINQITRTGLAFLVVRSSIGYMALLAFLAYKLRRRLLGINNDVEMFLAEYKNCMPTRYTYRQIRKMTGNFKDKLGEGGFGSVYRGKQLTGRRPVAVKILGKSDTNGQDFINEVATIGRIHHANVVQLMGFCVEGSKRALVYEFMSNGSLDRHIYDKGGGHSLSWRETLEITIGIARGIEYLHRGCDVKILHFDIKPQNILLDEDFNPKIADFGLAKSYPAEKNTITMTAVRGTIGYMAPELFYASAGGVSSKSDVYSFGMLLMEMAGKRRNVDADAGNCSGEDYLPSWIYNQLEQGKDITGFGADTEEEKIIMNKLFIVALWCIQMKPEDRPSMGKVVGILKGDDVQHPKMPARPFLASTDLVILEDIVATGSGSSELSTMPLLSSDAD